SFSTRSSSRWSSRIALRRRDSAAMLCATWVIRRTSLLSHWVLARVAARIQAAMTRLRSIEARRWSSKDELRGLKLSFPIMVRPSMAQAFRRRLRGAGFHARRAAREYGGSQEPTSGLEGKLPCSWNFSGDFLKIEKLGEITELLA